MTIRSFPGVFILVLLSPLFSMGQQILYTHHTTGTLKDFSAVRLGDSLLFSFKDLPIESRRAKHELWIADSTAHPTDPVDADVFTAARSGNDVYLYFFEGKSGSRKLKAWICNETAKTRVESATGIELPGNIIGNYVDKNLFFILLSETGRELSLVEINGMTVVSQKRITLPQAIAPGIAVQPADFYTDASEENTFHGRAQVKVFKYEKLYVSYDLGSRTYVMTLDPQTGATDLKSFLASSEATDFRSFVIDGKVFRVLQSRKKFQLDIFDLATGNALGKSELTATPDFKIYFRYGRKNVIHHKEKFSAMMKVGSVSDPMLTVLKRDGQYIVQWGNYFDEKGTMAGGASPAGMITMIVGTAILQLMEGPGVNRYFYYAWNEQQNSFQRLDPPLALVRDAIDCYEIDHVIRFEDKRYIAYRDGIAALYYDSSARTVSVVYFH